MLTLLLPALLSVTHAPGWSYPMITTDVWTYYGSNWQRLEVTGSDTLHQVWQGFNNETRVGYKVYQPDGSVIYPEIMVSANVWSAYTSSCLVNQDSVALFWREGSTAWFTLRDSDGSELIPRSLLVPDSYVNRPRVEASADTLGRIHCVFEISGGVCYAVIDPGLGEVFRDTIPGSEQEVSNIYVDGNRVHIYYRAGYAVPAYVQYDLAGNIQVPEVELVQNLQFVALGSSVTVDSDRNFWCFLRYVPDEEPNMVLSLIKVDGLTGQVLLVKEMETPNLGTGDANIIPAEGGESLYLMWLASYLGDQYIYFAIIDKTGGFLEEPYVAYDYSDEDVQQLNCLDATSNDAGDAFAIWNAYFPDIDPYAYHIVMGCFDHNYAGITEEDVHLTPDISLSSSSNPFSTSVSFHVEGSTTPSHLIIYDTSGRLIRTLDHSGEGCYFWDGCDSQGNEVPVGSYIVAVQCGAERTALRVVKLD